MQIIYDQPYQGVLCHLDLPGGPSSVNSKDINQSDDTKENVDSQVTATEASQDDIDKVDNPELKYMAESPA